MTLSRSLSFQETMQERAYFCLNILALWYDEACRVSCCCFFICVIFLSPSLAYKPFDVMTLIVLPSTPAVEKASAYLTSIGIAHQCIPIPQRLDYENGSRLAIYAPGENGQALSKRLTEQRLVVMRVFKDFVLQADDMLS